MKNKLSLTEIMMIRMDIRKLDEAAHTSHIFELSTYLTHRINIWL
jgi:hypothetical protein